MARLQRKKSPVTKKKKQSSSDSVTPTTDKNTKPNENRARIPAVGGNIKQGQILSQKTSGNIKTQFGKVKSPLYKGIQFLREAKIELKKVTWPSRKQTIGFTGVVIVLVMIISFFLGLVDYGLSNLIRVLLQ
jgi:preprotein translocase subunit SecE